MISEAVVRTAAFGTKVPAALRQALRMKGSFPDGELVIYKLWGNSA
jgi:hypothetical protein